MNQVELEYLSIGCNPHIKALDWSSNGIVAYGGNRLVALYCPNVR
jgi:hypothetical protein